MIIIDDKGVNEIVANGKIFVEDVVTDTNNSTFKQNILSTSIIVAKGSNVSVNKADDCIVKNVLHNMNNKHTIKREEDNKETDDIHTIKQESLRVSIEEKGNIVANTFHYESIEDQMDTLNTKRNNAYVNINAIDKHIQEIDNLHHNVDKTLDPGVKLSP